MQKKHGILYKTKVYLAGNLENSGEQNWRLDITKRLKKLGIISLDPTMPCFLNQVHETEEDRLWLKEMREKGNFDALHRYMSEIIRKDLRMVDLSSFVIFNLEVEKPTFGTIHELAITSQQRKPILIIIKNRKNIPLWIAGLINKNCIFETQESLLKYLEGVNNEKIKIDSKYWKLLDYQYR